MLEMSETTENQLKAALTLLNFIEENHSKELGFGQSCDLIGAIERIQAILDYPQIKYAAYDVNKRQEILHKYDADIADILIEAAAA